MALHSYFLIFPASAWKLTRGLPAMRSMAKIMKRLVGFCIAGQVPLTESTWCLYWLVVPPESQRRGVGAALQSAIEREMQASGGQRIVCETSGRDCYAPARAFYRSAGYVEYGRVADYYSHGDCCFFFFKVI